MNLLAGARFTRFTDWEGSEFDAAISADGKFVAFVSDQGGPFDVWVSQVGNDELLTLSQGRLPVSQPDRRTRSASPERTRTCGSSCPSARDGGSATSGWYPRSAGSRACSCTGRFGRVVPDGPRLVYHTAGLGRAIFVADRYGANRRPSVGEPRPITFPRGLPTGVRLLRPRAPDPYDMDIWRIPSVGGPIERLTRHRSRVSYSTFLDDRTLIYVASRPDAGSGLYAMDVERRISHAVSLGFEEYRSVAASADGRRLAATVSNPARSLWSAPITDRVADEGSASRLSIPVVRAAAPRFGPGEILFLSSKGAADGIWRYKDGVVTELWRGSEGAVAAPPDISADNAQLSFVARQNERGRLYVASADGTGSRRLAESLDARDAPSWSPDGKWIAVVASEGTEQPVFKVPVDGGAPVRLAGGINMNPLWSPDGRLIVYCQQGVGPSCTMKGVTPGGQPVPVPEMAGDFGRVRWRFFPGGKSLVLMLTKDYGYDFWQFDLASGDRRQLTDLRTGYDVRSFDVSPDGKQILFDRFRDNSDVVLIDRSR